MLTFRSEMERKLEHIRDLEGRRCILVQKIHAYFKQEHHNSTEDYVKAYRCFRELSVLEVQLVHLVGEHFTGIAEGEWGYPDGNLTPERLKVLLEAQSE